MKKLAWIFIATFTGVMVLTFAVFRPVSAQTDRVAAQRVSAEAQTQQLERRLAELSELAANEEAVRAEQTLFQIALPDRPEAAEMIRQTQAAADMAGVRLDAFTPSIPQPGKTAGSDSIVLTLRATGGWNPIQAFVAAVTNDVPRAVRIDTVTVTPTGTPSLLNAPEATATIVTTVFVNAPVPAAQANAAAAPAN